MTDCKLFFLYLFIGCHYVGISLLKIILPSLIYLKFFNLFEEIFNFSYATLSKIVYRLEEKTEFFNEIIFQG